MGEYRAYILNHDDKIMERVDFVSDDDEAAKKHARDVSGGRAMEIWQGKRMVARLEAKK